MRIFFWPIVFIILSSHELGAQQTHALLVGVGNYLSPADCKDQSQVAIPQGIKSLRCPENDIQLFQTFLQERFSTSELESVILMHDKATRVAVIEALRSIAKRCRPSDTFLFYYTGHGAQVKNPKSTEADGLDEVILPYDAVLKGKLIRDKEIRDLLAAITANGTEVIALFDCCHSGSMTRDVSYESKSIPTIEAEIEWYMPTAVQGNPEKLLVISAARSDELAMARSDANGRITSLFTQSLVTALNHEPFDKPLDELMRDCQLQFDAQQVVQHPVIDATSQRRNRTFTGKEFNGSGGLVLQRWMNGSRALVYGTDVIALHVGSVVIDSTGVFSASVVRIVSPVEAEIQFAMDPQTQLPLGAQLRIDKTYSDLPALKVFFSRYVADGRGSEFSSSINSFEHNLRQYVDRNRATISLVDSAHADYVIRLVHAAQTSSWALERIHPGGDAADSYPTETRSVACDLNSSEAACRYMQGVMIGIARYLSLLHLHGCADFSGELVVTCNGLPLTGIEAEVHMNDYIQLAMRIKGGAAAGKRKYVYVLGLSQNGSSSLLYPLSGSNAENYLPLDSHKAGDVIPLAAYHVAPPTGNDHVLLLALDTPLSNPYLLEQPEPGTRSVSEGTAINQLSINDSSGHSPNGCSFHCSTVRLMSKD